MSTQTCYQIMGIPVEASREDIKKAYRDLARRYHPDHNPNNPEAAERFKQISAAYRILIHEERRAEYDRQLDRRRSPAPVTVRPPAPHPVHIPVVHTSQHDDSVLFTAGVLLGSMAFLAIALLIATLIVSG